MSKSKFEISKEGGPHLRLLSLVGNWDGRTRTWLEKDVLADESPTTSKIVSLLNKRFIRYEYRGIINGKTHEGLMVWGFDLGNNKCVCSWIDSFHMGTGIMFSEGSETSNGFCVNGQYSTSEMPEPWGWRTELEIINSDQFILRAYNISPTGEETKAVETINLRIDL
ncbi:hypothetical protein D3C87_314710 [compost metagenome]